MNALTGIHELTEIIVSRQEDRYGELHAACDRLYHTLLDLTGLDENAEANRKNLSIKSGNAIGLTWAAMCIKDIMRTKRFMSAVAEATSDLLKTDSKKTLHILYAGTGPFATLILPLLQKFSPGQVQFSLVEVNKDSYQALKKLVELPGFSPYVRRLVNADATTWTLPPGEAVDIFICEAMQQGLKDEPQVAIFRNIVPQLSTQTILIPQRVRLELALVDMAGRMQEKSGEREGQSSIHRLQNVFVLDRDSTLAGPANGDQYPVCHIPIPTELTPTHSTLCLLTEIEIYKDSRLCLDESALTLPLKLKELDGSEKEICLHYETGKRPGMRF